MAIENFEQHHKEEGLQSQNVINDGANAIFETFNEEEKTSKVDMNKVVGYLNEQNKKEKEKKDRRFEKKTGIRLP